MTNVAGRLACFGLIGTTVADEGLMERAYAESIATQGVVPGTTAYARCMAQVHRSRGKSVIDVLRELFPENEARAQAAYLAFDKSFSGAVRRSGIQPVPGAPEVLDELAAAGYRCCLLSSLSRRQLDVALTALDWHGRADLALSSDEGPRGGPWPDQVLQAMLRLGVTDVRDTIVVQATESGVVSGCRSGAGLVVGVLTGTHPAARLRSAGASQVLASVADVPAMLAGTDPALAAARRVLPRPAPDTTILPAPTALSASDQIGHRPRSALS